MQPIIYYQAIPNSKSKIIDIFKQKIKSKKDPVTLDLDNKFINECEFEELDCFENAKKLKDKKTQGEVILGWMLWEKVPGVLYEAVAHAVYKSVSNRLYDVTPQSMGGDKVLFFEDPKLIYENKQIDSVYTNVPKDSLVDQYIKLQRQYFLKTNENHLENIIGVINVDDISKEWLEEYDIICSDLNITINKIKEKYFK